MYEHYLPLIHQMADASQQIAQTYYRQELSVTHKQDASPVTIADREIEHRLRQMIQENHASHGIIGEELGTQQADAEYVWVLDPIDGTSSFIAGRPIFGTLIALLHRQKPVLGLINQPITKERWIGYQGGKATLNDTPITVSNCTELQQAHIATTGPDYFSDEHLAIFQKINKQSIHTPLYGGDCYNYGLFARGSLDLVIESGLKPYDCAALIPIIEAAGGLVRDWHGQPLNFQYNHPLSLIAAPNAALLEQVQAFTRTA